ncbi:hypothetical protein ACOYXF_05060 [Pseudomonas sp. Tul1A2]
MSILNIIFVCISSLIYFGIFYGFKELAKTYDWAYNVGVPCLVAATTLLNYIKDRISERDPTSKLHKVTTELNSVKTEHETNNKRLKANHEKELKECTKKYENHITELKNEITLLHGKISIKDTVIHGFRSGITKNLLKHGSTQEFFLYAQNLCDKINSDLDMNTLAPVLTPETMKYLDIFQ